MRALPTVFVLALVPFAAGCASGSGSNLGLGGAGGASSNNGAGGRLNGASVSSTTGAGTGGSMGALSGVFAGSGTTGVGGSAGSNTTSGAGPATTGNSSSGSAGCGLQASDPTCNACLDTSCCAEAQACSVDTGCTSCLGVTNPPPSCDSDAALGALGTCLQNNCNVECGGSSTTSSSSSSSGATTTSSSSTSSSSSGGVLTCTDVDGVVGCCDTVGKLHYCTNTNTLKKQTCPTGTVCGWDSTYDFYDCVSPPSTSDPTNTYPIACGGGSSTSSSSSGGTTTSSSSSTTSSSSSSSSSGSTGVTWTTLYNTVFGPNGTSSCMGSSCHTNSQSGFKCGTTKATCYSGIVAAGLVTVGAGASSSALVNPAQSPLCGSLGGNMPKNGTCVTAAELSEIQSWLASGAPNN